MFEVGEILAVVFLKHGDDRRRALVVSADDSKLVAEFQEPVRAAPGAQVQIYHHVNRAFVTTPATVQAFLRSNPFPAVRFIISGPSEPAEVRESFRTCVAGAGLHAGIEGECAGDLIDVSPEGLSVLTKGSWEVGGVLTIRLAYQGEQYCGQAVIRNVQSYSDGRFRYGLEVLSTEQRLQRAMQRIGMNVQQDQLRRVHAGIAPAR